MAMKWGKKKKTGSAGDAFEKRERARAEKKKNGI